MPVNFKRTCGWSWHAVQRKQTTCWDLAFCKQNNEKHNHGRRQGQGPATKERQLISDSVVTVLQIGIFHNYIVESRGTLRKETKNNLLPPSPPAVVKWPLLSCQDKKNILIFWQNSKLQSRDWHTSTILLILAFTTESSLALSRWTSWRFLVVTIDPSLDSIWTGCRENWAEMRELPCKQMYSYLPSSAFDMRVNLTSE